MALTDDQLHDVGHGVMALDKALKDVDLKEAPVCPGWLIGDALVFALARHGFVITFDETAAAEVAIEHGPEQGNGMLQ